MLCGWLVLSMLRRILVLMLNYCLEKARKHDSGGRVTVYACATDKRGNILAEGGNSYVKTHPLQASIAKRVGLAAKQFLHAEVACIAKLARLCKECDTLYIARVDKVGNPLPAEPCVICTEAIELAGIKNIIFTS